MIRLEPTAKQSPEQIAVVQTWPANVLETVGDHGWMVAHCLPRQEKKLVSDLRARELPHVLFLERRLRRYPGKGTQISLVPLLGGYVFVKAGRYRRDDVFSCKRVVRILDVGQPQQLVDDLRNLAHLVSTAHGPLVLQPDIVSGGRVKLTAGAFAGLEGVVVRRQGIDQIVVNIHILGSSVAAQLPVETAEALIG